MTQHGEHAAPAGRSEVRELRPATTNSERSGPHPGERALPHDRHQAILEATKRVGAVLKSKGHTFALAGSVAVDSSGNAYLTGFATSTNFPTAHPLQRRLAGGTFDAIVAKVGS